MDVQVVTETYVSPLLASGHTLTQHNPDVFHRRHIGTKFRPGEMSGSAQNPEDMWEQVQTQGGVLLQEWHYFRLEHLISVPLSSQISTKSSQIRDGTLMAAGTAQN